MEVMESSVDRNSPLMIPVAADSVAEDELAETGVKLRALLDVMESVQ